MHILPKAVKIALVRHTDNRPHISVTSVEAIIMNTGSVLVVMHSPDFATTHYVITRGEIKAA